MDSEIDAVGNSASKPSLDGRLERPISDGVDAGFRERVYELVGQIPRGRVMTYGQIAALCGSPQAARIVGGVAHFGDPDLPWQRVVNKSGGLATGYPGGRAGHKEHLQSEGTKVSKDYKVDVNRLLWSPSDSYTESKGDI